MRGRTKSAAVAVAIMATATASFVVTNGVGATETGNGSVHHAEDCPGEFIKDITEDHPVYGDLFAKVSGETEFRLFTVPDGVLWVEIMNGLQGHQRFAGGSGQVEVAQEISHIDICWPGVVTTSEPPVETSEPPIDTTEPPVVTTEPPIDTTEPPVDTTEPPVVTTEPPVTPTTTTTTTSTTTTAPPEQPVPTTEPPAPFDEGEALPETR